MKAILFCLLASVLSTLPVGGQNPFDIGIATDSSHSIDPSSTEPKSNIVESANPFDINHVKNTDNPVDLVSDLIGEVKEDTKKNRNQYANVWMGLSLLLALLLTSISIYIDRSRVIQMFSAVFNTTTLKNLYRSTKNFFQVQNVLLYIAFFVNVTIFLTISSQKGYLTFSVHWLWTFIGLIAIYFGRHILMSFMSWIFPIDSSVDNQNYSIGLHNAILGIGLLPVVIGLQYGPDTATDLFFYFGVVIIILCYILRQAKGILLTLGIKGFNPIYFFIYLCAVEIAPVLVAIKSLSTSI